MSKWVIVPLVALVLVYALFCAIAFLADFVASNPIVLSFPAAAVLIVAGALFLE